MQWIARARNPPKKSEPKFGFCVVGLVAPDALVRNSTARAGEAAAQELLATEEAYRSVTITLVDDVARPDLLGGRPLGPMVARA